VTKDMITRALTLSTELNLVLGGRDLEDEDPLTERSDPAYVRAQAFALFVRAYDECRRGVAYLRWHHGDATAIVPSLYPRRGRRPGEPEEAANDAGDAANELAVVRTTAPVPASEPAPTNDVTPATDALASA
jgi:hypothetical protein